MEDPENDVPKSASLRSRLQRSCAGLDDFNPSIEMTQPVKLPSREAGDPRASCGEPDVTGSFLFDNLPVMIWIKDTENRIQKMNRWAAKAMGIEPSEAVGKSEWELQPGRADTYFEDDAKVIRSRKPIYGIVERFLSVKGGDLWVLTDKIPILDCDGAVTGIVVVARDISRQKDAERRLVESQERLQLALWGAGMGSWDWYPAEDRFVVDDPAARILGRAAGDQGLSFRKVKELIHPGDILRITDLLDKHAEGISDAFDGECRIRNIEGGWNWVSMKGRVVDRDGDGRPLRLSGTILDVTRRKDTEDEKEGLQRQMQYAQKLESLGVLAGGIAHDFNNLLTGILSQTGIARVDVAQGNANVQEHLDKIESAARRMADLTKQMLAYSGRGRFEISRFDLNEVIQEIVYLLKSSVTKSARFQMDLSEDAPFMEGDATQVHQILLNLVTNASDAIGEEKGTIALRTGFEELRERDMQLVPWGSELRPGRFVYVEVEDDGCGMDDETKTRLFEPFYTTKFAGRGLGLAAVLGIVRAHHGLIRVKTAMGAGTVFRIYAPAARKVDRKKPAPAPVVRPVTAGGRFLIIDDEPVIRAVCGQAMKLLGFEVEEADDGPAGLDRFDTARIQGNAAFSGVFLDMTMPQMNGCEVYREIRRRDISVPICIMSGYSAEEITSRFESDAALSFLPKPFPLENIEKIISAMQSGRQRA